MRYALIALLALLNSVPIQAQTMELQKGDHICYIGNTLADRMQHSNWLETLIMARFPNHELVFRNLGFSGDEIELSKRIRSEAFGTPDQWLTKCQADVIFAFFGYNESFAGEAGLEKFKSDLEKWIKLTRSQKYNGKSAPRIVLFSPIAHENLKTPNLPDGKENNARLKLYTAAMSEVAKANDIGFIDLFTPTLEAYAKADHPLTINGIHLNDLGDQVVAKIIDTTLFGAPRTKYETGYLEKLRQAIQDKNFYWFERYRTTDGYSIYGGRADLKFVDNQTNRVVAQREMEVLDVLTANRDKKGWAVAQGKEYTVDDSNTPPFIPVKTNKPGTLSGGRHAFLGGKEAIEKMTVHKNMKVTLFASEEKYPELAKPVQMAFDPKGRLWVACWPTYPHWKPKEPMNDKLVILEDTDGDGEADKKTIFADDLHNPTGFEFYNGGVLIAQAPDLMFLKDTDGDGKADYRERVLHGLDSADTHHTSNSFVLDPGGALYFQEGTFHHTQVESPYGPVRRCANAGVFRYEPRAQKFDVYVSFGFANPHGHVFDRWGQDIVVDGTGSNPYHAALFSGHLEYPNKHNRPPQVYQQRTRPCPGMEYLYSRHFPDEMQGNLLVGNVIGFQGILQYKIVDKDSSFAGVEMEPILSSSDPNFRPSDMKIGPDGAIWFIDWHNPIIGHMQHNLRDPSRDREHGRIYRVTYNGRELLKPKKVEGESIENLLDLLKEHEDRVRNRARIELGSRKTEEVLQAVKKWLASLNKKDEQYEHHVLEALWLHQSHNVVNLDLLKQVLNSEDFRARAAAARVLCYWRDRIPDALEMFKALAADKSGRVRLEAVRAASFFAVPEAVEIPLIAAELPTDQYIEFVRSETMRTLDPIWKGAVAQGKTINVTTDAGAKFFLRSISLDQLLKMNRSKPVYLELLYRTGLRDEVRREALSGLAKLEKKHELQVLIDTIKRIDNRDEKRDETILFDLVRLLTGRSQAELKEVHADLEKLATTAKEPVIRQIGYVALINVDGSTEKAWTLANKSVNNLRDFLAAMPLISDATLRASLYSKVEPLVHGLPQELASQKENGKALSGRFVRIELPGRQRTLTLAEVEVFSDGRNVARQGKASQTNTAYGGEASRGIDGNKSGSYGDGGQTHTREGINNAWWEVDLGRDFPIDSIVVYNRTDGNLGDRLKNYTLKILDAGRKIVHQKAENPAPAVSATFPFGRESPEKLIRRAAMVALISVRGEESKTFQTLAKFVKEDTDRYSAIRAIQRIPRNLWPKEQAPELLEIVMSAIRKMQVQDRTSPDGLDAMEFGYALANLLPAKDAKKAREVLSEIGVRVIRIGTLPERMAYDKDLIIVKAGKPVEFIFENFDLMPHNLVITQPGAMEQLGMAAEDTATSPDAAARHYVPKSNKILLSSILLQPHQVQKLSFIAPNQPGVYPYVCTYPGHWRRMYGALYVVEDLDEALANPEAYLTKIDLPIKDELLKDRRPRTEWKFADLAEAVNTMKSGRSYTNGKQTFTVASCISCHKMEGAGQEFGPDLTKLDPKYTNVDILKHILEPSEKIDPKYKSYTIVDLNGKTFTGMILEETKKEVKLIENPLAKAEPILIKVEDIDRRRESPVSLMPKGLFDKLTKEEILDLIAYVASKADKKSPLFQAGDGHNHH